MKTKTHTPSPLESSEDSQNPKPKEKPPGSTERKEAARRNWRDGSMIGARFGKLTVIGAGVPHPTDPVKTRVPCRCDCGAEVSPLANNLRSPKNCVACKSESMSKRFKTHGRSPKDVYRIWSLMRDRCRNPKNRGWRNYGGRGISICQRWEKFENFRDDMGPRPSPIHTLDRINNECNYEPGNCRWATRKQQNRNRSVTRWLTLNGETKPLGEWAENSPVRYTTIANRILSGWNPEEAVFTPNNQKPNNE